MKLGPTAVSQAGLDLIHLNEGLSLTAYKDTADRWTIGYGHLLRSYIPPITLEVADKLLMLDLWRAQDAVATFTNVVLEQHQFDALVSFVYNIGIGAYAGSTLLRKLNAGDSGDVIAQEFRRWIYAKGKESKGLKVRREREIALFLKGASRETPACTSGDVLDVDKL